MLTTQSYWLLTKIQKSHQRTYKKTLISYKNGSKLGVLSLMNKNQHVTFTLNKETCPPVRLNNEEIPQAETAKYLGIHLDRRMTWKSQIWNKRKQLGCKLRKIYWLLDRKSRLSLYNKVLLYKAIITPVWTYGIQLWGSASNSNIEILERFQAKVLRIIVNAPWYVTNEIIRRDLNIKTQ